MRSCTKGFATTQVAGNRNKSLSDSLSGFAQGLESSNGKIVL